MLLFTCDYLEGAHEKILQRLAETNLEKMPGYENDPYCISAAEKIRAACECPEGSVFFTVGGTQTNAVVISTMLQSCEGVLAADTGHVNVHEAGAIEYTGHKVLSLPAYEGKMKAPDLKDYLVNFYKDPSHEHMVIPGMVYLSYPTEYGTLYTKKELNNSSFFYSVSSIVMPCFCKNAMSCFVSNAFFSKSGRFFAVRMSACSLRHFATFP